MGRLSGKVAIVTGAGQGVGRGIALALAGEGAAVVLAGRTLAKVERTAGEVAAEGGVALAVECDVGNPADAARVVEQALDRFGAIHVLVNNAHTSRPMVPLVDVGEADMEIAFAGTRGALLLMQACHPHFLAAGYGRVINLGSVAGIRGDAGFGAYAAAKEAVRALTRVAAREWGPQGITANVLCPFSDSPGVDYMIRKNPAVVDQLCADTALKRLGSSRDDVGRTAVFLASADGGYVTGQTINVDGGIWIAA